MTSLGRIAAIAGNTLTELTRQKAFYFILFFALVLIGSSAFAARLTFQQELQVLKDIALGAISIFTSLLAVITTARLLPGDVEERTLYTILAKPIRRGEYLIGKFFGVVALLAISTVVMSAMFFVVLFVREQTVLAETVRQMSGAPAEQLTAALSEVRSAGIHANLVPAIVITFVKAAVLAALTLFVSTFATSNIFTLTTVVFVYFIGHLQGAAREYLLEENAGTFARLFLGFVALCFPDLQLFNFVDDAAAGTAIPFALFARSAALGVVYVIVYLMLAWAAFQRKEL